MSKSRGLLRGFKTLQAHSSASTPLMEAAISRLNALPSAAHDSGGSYCFSHCADVAIRYKGLSVHAIGRNSSLSNTSLSSITHIRFLHVPTNQGRKNSKRSWVEPIEQTEVLVERNSESQLLKLKDSKEAVYGALDSWVAWEQDFPLVVLKRALHILEKKQQWHRIIQGKTSRKLQAIHLEILPNPWKVFRQMGMQAVIPMGLQVPLFLVLALQWRVSEGSILFVRLNLTCL